MDFKFFFPYCINWWSREGIRIVDFFSFGVLISPPPFLPFIPLPTKGCSWVVASFPTPFPKKRESRKEREKGVFFSPRSTLGETNQRNSGGEEGGEGRKENPDETLRTDLPRSPCLRSTEECVANWAKCLGKRKDRAGEKIEIIHIHCANVHVCSVLYTPLWRTCIKVHLHRVFSLSRYSG